MPECKRKCGKKADEDCKDHCEDCFKKLLLAQDLMNLATGDTNTVMSEHSFARLFKNILFPLFTKEDLQKFNDEKVRNECMNEFARKFEEDHNSIQNLMMNDRIEQYDFDQRSVQDELMRRYIQKYTTNGIMDLNKLI